MTPATPIVFVVDDDISVRESLELLIQSEGWHLETFASAQEFLDRRRSLAPSRLIRDVSLPGFNGLDLQKRVAVERPDIRSSSSQDTARAHNGPSNEGRGHGVLDEAIK